MRINSFLFCFLMSALGWSQANVIFKDRNYFEAQNEAREKNKPLVVMFYAHWCEHCKKMKSSVLQDTDVVLFYAQNYITVAVDAESDAGSALKQKFKNDCKVRSYPTFAYFSPKEVYWGGFSGEMKKESFIEEGSKLLQSENQLPQLKAAFEAAVSNPEACLKYIASVRKAGFDATSITQRYLKTVPKENLFTELNWRIIANGINTIEAPEFQWIIDYQKEFGQAASPQRVEKKIIFTVQDNLRGAADALDTLSYRKKRVFVEKIQWRKTDSLLYKYDTQLYASVQDWKRYQQVTLEKTDTFASRDANQLIENASVYLNYIQQPDALRKAIAWVDKAIALSENAEKHLVKAKLYLKLKDKNQALQAAETAKKWSEQMGWSSSESDIVIQEIKAAKL